MQSPFPNDTLGSHSGAGGTQGSLFSMNTDEQVTQLKNWANLVGNDNELQPNQIADLHINVDMMKDCVPYGDISSRTYQIALGLNIKNMLESIKVDVKGVNNVVGIVSRQHEDNFALTRAQHRLLIKFAKQHVWQSNRTSWDVLASDIQSAAENHPESSEIHEPGKQNRVDVLVAECKKQEKGAKGGTCLDVYDTMLSPRSKELGEATAFLADRTQPTGFYNRSRPISASYQIHTALIRRFTYEEQWDDWIIAKVTRDEDGLEVQVQTKLKASSGKVAKGEDYWSKMDAWFAKLLAVHGPDLNSAAWQAYYVETVRLDRQRFGHGSMPPNHLELLDALPAHFNVPVAPVLPPPAPASQTASGSGLNLLAQMRQQQMSS